MWRTALVSVAAAGALFALHCGQPSGTNDAGTQDAGQRDSGVADAGGTSDAGPSDAGTVDAGGVDAGNNDAGTVDSGTGIDAGLDAGIDAGTFQALAPCTTSAQYQTGTDVIQFGGNLGLAYSPNCLSVPAGTFVQWVGDFSIHPLAASTRGTQPSPIQSTGGFTGDAGFVFAVPGFYPYYCQVHGSNAGTGMSGVVQVTP